MQQRCRSQQSDYSAYFVSKVLLIQRWCRARCTTDMCIYMLWPLRYSNINAFCALYKMSLHATKMALLTFEGLSGASADLPDRLLSRVASMYNVNATVHATCRILEPPTIVAAEPAYEIDSCPRKSRLACSASAFDVVLNEPAFPSLPNLTSFMISKHA